tara:strand:+ start:4501 stop:4848 length:348 start_codon:yes stop_codon:yes gene_type:complete
MNETPDYMALVDLISELDNMEMMRITGISLLNRRENTEVNEEHIALINEALGEIVAMTLAFDTQNTEASEESIDGIIIKAQNLMESNNTVDIIHALCGVNETPVVESADRWVAYV